MVRTLQKERLGLRQTRIHVFLKKHKFKKYEAQNVEILRNIARLTLGYSRNNPNRRGGGGGGGGRGVEDMEFPGVSKK